MILEAISDKIYTVLELIMHIETQSEAVLLIISACGHAFECFKYNTFKDIYEELQK
jgi:hypothetical protein